MLTWFSRLVLTVVALAAALNYFSFWWIGAAAFFAAAVALSSGPTYGIIITANREGRLGVFPALLAVRMVPYLVFGAFVFWIARLLS